ncbi:MAG: cyclic nucleotide-binding domain-containing protein [Deltaproteobacteria bacterium]|nr:cyclic nucleotide-binding domain-containing protein [Deltaproteobacteria bacterium]
MMPITGKETYEDGQIIFEEGSYGDWVYTVESGKVEISRKLEDEKIIISTLTEGDIFGEVAFLANVPRTATATAVGKTVIGIVDRAFLDNEYNKSSQYFRLIIKNLALRIQNMNNAFVESKKDQ